MDSGFLNSVLFFDLKKAFDCVLPMKIHAHRIQGQALKWFRSYLTGREQMYKIKQTMSSKKSLSVVFHRVQIWAHCSF